MLLVCYWLGVLNWLRLQAGMTLNATNGAVSTANLTQGPGTFNVCVTVTDTAQNTQTSAFNSFQKCCSFTVAGTERVCVLCFVLERKTPSLTP